jgi:hypothetical protein
LVGLALFAQKASPPEEDLNAGSPSVLRSEVLGIMDLGVSWQRGFLFRNSSCFLQEKALFFITVT